MQKVRKSKIELIGPNANMKFLMNLIFRCLGFLIYSSSTLSVGNETCDRSQRKLLNRIWLGNIGKNGKNRTAPIILNIFPKFELNHIIIYFIVLPNVFLPSITHSRSSLSHFLTKIISAASLATSTALLTDIPTSALLSEGASLIPSQRYPTTNHFFLSTEIILSF